VVTVSREGFVRQIPMAVYQRSMTAGKRIALDRYEGDFVQQAFVASTDDTLLAFSSDGRAYALSVRDLPEAGLSSRGKALAQLFELGKKPRVAAVHVVHEFRADRSVLFATAEGTVKRTTLDQYANARAGGIDAIKLTGRDEVVEVRVTDGEGEVVLVGRGGRAIRFPEGEVPLMGRVAQGVRGIKLKDGETVAGMAVPRRDGGELCVVTERGWVKRVPLDDLQPQGRGGMGTVLLAPAKETGEVVAARDVHAGEDLMVVTGGGRTLRVKPDAVTRGGRATPPEKAVALTGNERVAEVWHVAERELPSTEATGGEVGSPPGSEAGYDPEGVLTGSAGAEAAAPALPAEIAVHGRRDEVAEAHGEEEPPLAEAAEGRPDPGDELDLFA
jgi:DNA gyrase subunit A